MAKKVQKSAGVEIVADTAEEQAQTASGSAGSDYTYIACGLALGHKFDDVDNGNGGFKTVELPGINYKLIGKTDGILNSTGTAVLVRVAKADWEDIRRKHGRERIFTAVPPLVFEVPGGEAELKSRDDEVKAMDNGASPVDPKSAGVEKAAVTE